MRKISLLALLVLPVLLLPLLMGMGQVQAQSEEALIRLQAATFDPLNDGEPVVVVASPDAPANPYLIVQFAGPVQPTWLDQIELLGGEVLGYIPDNAHIVRIAPEDADQLRSLSGVRWVGTYHPGYKLSPALAASTSLASASSKVDITVMAFAGESLAEVRSVLADLGATFLDEADTPVGVIFRVIIPADAIPALMQNPAIGWLEGYTPAEIANNQGRAILNVETIWEDLGFYGENQIVAVSDSGLSVQGQLNRDFLNAQGNSRLVRGFAPSEMNLANQECSAKTDFTDINGHGTHVAGSVLGNGANSGSNPASRLYADSFAGGAPEARLVFMALNTDGSSGIQCISTNGSFIAKGYEEGARISSNSWGGFNPQDPANYNVVSSITDNYIWNNKDYLVLFAAGNAGPGPQTIGAPGTAKNVLTIGASQSTRTVPFRGSGNPNAMAAFSSRGPTNDGRIKPDVVAPGMNIVSVRGAQAGDSYAPFNGNASYAAQQGTSMATPLAAGSATLVREWLNKTRTIANPSAALQKALLIHNAIQLPGEGLTSFNTGYGRIDVKNVINATYAIFDDNVQGLNTQQLERTYTISVSTTALGVLTEAPANLASSTGNPAAAATVSLKPAPVLASGDLPLVDRANLTLESLPGHEAPADNPQSIPTGSPDDASRLDTLETLDGPAVPELESAALAAAPGDSSPLFASSLQGNAALSAFPMPIVGGGNFEEPDWSEIWSKVWLGTGLPVITNEPNFVIEGRQSLVLGVGGNDAAWYPFSMPDQLDTQNASGIVFDFRMVNLDPGFDNFCIGITDVSGFIVGADDGTPFVQCYTGGNDGVEDGAVYQQVALTFTQTGLDLLEGLTGYLVLYTVTDGLEPTMLAMVDRVAMVVDFPDTTLSTAPASGPPGTEFLLTGENNTPYGPVAVCQGTCSDATLLGVTYADASGDIAVQLTVSPDADPGQIPIQTSDFNSRTANTILTVSADTTASLEASPASGEAGSEFSITGSGFTPNAQTIEVSVNGQVLGTTGSNQQGAVAFTLQTSSNTPAGTLSVRATDSNGRSAETSITVTAPGGGGGGSGAAMSVTPQAAPAGTTFSFTLTGFQPGNITIGLDNEEIGQVAANAEGGAIINLETNAGAALGRYRLTATQGTRQASAEFEVQSAGDGGGGDTPTASGDGLHITLVWTDPYAQPGVTAALVNNLDLVVTTPGGETLFGNGGSSADTVNNVEVLRIEEPEAGQYQITVRGSRLSAQYGAQPFALIATTSQSFGANAANVNPVADFEAVSTLYLPQIVKE